MITINLNIGKLIDSVEVVTAPTFREGDLVTLLENELNLKAKIEKTCDENFQNISSMLSKHVSETVLQVLIHIKEQN